MNKNSIIKKTAEFARKTLEGEGSGHDWWHVYRVWRMAKRIAREEKADIFIVELAALLHDISDWKFSAGNDKLGSQITEKFLSKLMVDQKIINDVAEIVLNISYKGGTNKVKLQTMEGKIVQDADRLDAIGAIGIARTFAFGSSIKREFYNPGIKPKKYKDFEDFKNNLNKNTTINHFHEKLLLLKKLMHTKTAKKMAEGRHKYMEEYLKKFYKEWEGRE
jgi:uncharacterized protein